MLDDQPYCPTELAAGQFPRIRRDDGRFVQTLDRPVTLIGILVCSLATRAGPLLPVRPGTGDPSDTNALHATGQRPLDTHPLSPSRRSDQNDRPGKRCSPAVRVQRSGGQRLPVHHQYPSAPEIKNLRTVHASANERISRLRSRS